MEHYYTEQPNTPHQLTNIQYSVKDISLDLSTDAGVFSKTRVDYGSHALIHALPPLKGSILDLGCGYGPIGIALAKLNPESQVTMIDINHRAIELTLQNISKNNINNTQAYQSNGFEKVTGSFDTIVSNPPIRAGKKVIYGLFDQSIHYLNPRGAFYIVIQKKQGAPSALDKLITLYNNCEIINKKGGYWILKSVKAE